MRAATKLMILFALLSIGWIVFYIWTARHNNRLVYDLSAKACGSITAGNREDSIHAAAKLADATVSKAKDGLDLSVQRLFSDRMICHVTVKDGTVVDVYEYNFD